MKILAQESSWLERIDTALFCDVKKEAVPCWTSPGNAAKIEQLISNTPMGKGFETA